LRFLMSLTVERAWLRFERRPWVAAAFAAGLFIYFITHMTRFQLARVWPLIPVGDAAILYDASQAILNSGDYPARLAIGNVNSVFPYPPSAVLLLGPLGAAGPVAFMAIWLLFMALGFWVVLRTSLAGERRDIETAWPVIAAFALLVAGGPVEWDLRNANSNLVALGLVMSGYALAARRPTVGGVLIGMSVSLKLYSGLLLPWLLFRGPRPAFYSAALTCLGLWLVLPISIFGVTGTIHLYSGWIEQLRIIGDPWIYSSLALGQTAAPIVTLRRAAMTILGAEPEASSTRVLVLALWAVWLAALLIYAVRARKPEAVAVPSRATLADWTVLLLAPLPFSPWLEPYHAVPLVVGASLLLAILIDDRLATRQGATALAAVLGLGIIRLAPIPFTMRGLALLASFMVLIGTLAIVRRKLAPEPLVGSELSSKQ
jgi:Glycosyltransferase family 87